MKAIIFFIFFIFLVLPPVFGQIKIGDNPQNIDASSVLELESSSKVLVITRVTTLEMEAITPQRGGLVYNTDTECVNYYDGTQWVNLCDAVNFTITNDPIINGRSTIEITESAAAYNLEVAKNSILGDNIIDGGIGPDDIQDNSITQDKLAAESVGSSELRQNAVGSIEIRDGSIAPEDMANTIADQVLTTDENGIVQWEDTNDLFDLTFDKLDNTLTISRSTTPGVSTISLEALVGSDDQQLDLTGNILSIENDPNTVDLSTYLQQISINNRRITLTNGGFIDLPAGTVNTDNQTLTLTGNTLAITGGNNVNLNKYLDNTDEQQLSIAGNRISLTDGGFVDLPPGTVDTDEQQLSIVGNRISLTDGGFVDIPEGNLSLDDGFIFVGNAASEPTPVDVGGDVTMNNIGQFSIENNTIESNNIVNNTITLEDLNQNGAADGQVIKWDETLNAGLGAWTVANDIANGTGGNVNTDATLTGNGNTVDLGIADDAVTTLKILDDNVTPAKLEASATDGQILTTDGTDVVWADPVAGNVNTDATLIGNGNTVDLGIADDAVTTLKILDDNVTPAKLEASATDGQILTTDGTDVVWADPVAGNVNTDATLTGNGNTVDLGIADDAVTTIKILDDNVTPAKLEASATDGQILTTDGTDVVWADPVAGNVNTDATLIGNGNTVDLGIADDAVTTIKILDDNVTPAKLEASATDGQILTTDGTDVVWADPVAGNVNTDATLTGNGNTVDLGIADDAVTTIKILDDNVTPAKLEASATDGQILTTDGTDVVWADPVAGNVNTDATLIGNGNTVDLSIADDAVTTLKILDDNVTPAKLEASATDGQILTTDGTDVIWADPAAGNVNTDATLIGNGNTVDLGIADDAVTTIKILDDNVTPAKIEASATDGQFLATNGANVEWQDLTNPANSGSILFSDGTGGIAENNDQLFWNNTTLKLGVGAPNPDSKLDVNGQIRASTIANGDGAASLPAYRFQDDLNSGMWLPAESELAFSTNSLERLRIIEDGNVGIGLTVPTSKLHVDGDIRGDDIYSNGALLTPDYVFQKYFLGNSILNPSYEFNGLAEIEAFVKENNHLPGIQSAQAVKEQGFWNVSESSRVNLEKIEELFLHTIEQEKKIKELQKANTNMSSELEALKTQMEEIKTMLLEKQND